MYINKNNYEKKKKNWHSDIHLFFHSAQMRENAVWWYKIIICLWESLY